ncbi:MAG: type VI secretion system ATPase TssH [Bryobacteraceae bacterium]|nr:type VI secretion system ATPase TssH [Bryobacteraceae bacterium]
MNADLKALIGKLNDTTRGALEAGAGLCLSRTHYDVEIEHYLLKLMEGPEADFSRILRHFEANPSRLAADLTRGIDRLRTGNARTPAFSPTLVRMLAEAWTMGSLNYGGAQIRSAFTILALVADDELARLRTDFGPEFGKIKAEALREQLLSIVAGSREDEAAVETKAGPAPAGKQTALKQFTVDLTENARQGKVDAVLGRDFEIRQVVDILMRRRQNNPILTGEAGVGKTAVVEGFAARVAQGDVPPPLRNVAVRSLDLALLQAGAGIKGEFENRLKGLIEEVKSSPTPIILFIDEAHTMIGAGGQAGQGDAANILKPALARGELRTIAATTWSEYKKYFEKDAALARRFQVVKVEEPEEEQCMVMLRGIAPMLEKHHRVRILDEAISSVVRLTHRYLVGRQLPDKAVSVLDTACARLALGDASKPAAMEGLEREIDDLNVQRRILERESAAGADHAEKLARIAARRGEAQARLEEIRKRWEKETALVARIRELRQQLEAPTAATASASPGTAAQPAIAVAEPAPAGGGGDGGRPDSPAAARAQVASLTSELEALQGDQPLTRVSVDRSTVSEVISAWTGIPVGKMLKDEIQASLEMESHLGKRVIGQDGALEAISQRLRTAHASLDDPGKPRGVFLLVGPSGVGKTETALALSDLLYGGERNLITINMSEFQEAHTVSTLKGSPPGYVGYGEGGVLTEAVRRRPYSVVLLDEVEKAHPDVLELFYQVFDKGMMEDGEGRLIDFKNTVILLTTNAASDAMMRLCADPETMPTAPALVKSLKPELDKIFKPAFLGRLVIVPYYPVRDEALRRIIVLKMDKIKRRLQENHGIALHCGEAVLDEIGGRCTEVESGARNVDNILTNTLLPDISRLLLAGMAAGDKPSGIRVTTGPDGKFVYTPVVESAREAAP